ncbi:MAG: lysostaphin resistance A-like protein [Terracidiphilus sp.]|jgi:membrane protease YdiL (CAAX protease family)
MSTPPHQYPLEINKDSATEEPTTLEATHPASEPITLREQGDLDTPPQNEPGAPYLSRPSVEWAGETEPDAANFDPTQPPLFQSWSEPPIIPPTRIPNIGDIGILCVFIFLSSAASILLMFSAVHFHLFGVTDMAQATSEIHYTLGGEVALYLLTFLASLLVFPLLWHKGFFAGLQWNAAIALGLRRWLFLAAFICFVLALVNGWLMPGPDNAPIDKIFRTPGAAWLLFAFGVTAAPFFEEIGFRGFLLPALCTAWDWSIERSLHPPPPPLDANGHPEWSTVAMVIGSILTSVPFAWMHAEQTGYSLGPFLLLVGVSLVLCLVRLATRSLAASVLVHASYNLLLFSLMLLGTSGFQHLDKM